MTADHVAAVGRLSHCFWKVLASILAAGDKASTGAAAARALAFAAASAASAAFEAASAAFAAFAAASDASDASAAARSRLHAAVAACWHRPASCAPHSPCASAPTARTVARIRSPASPDGSNCSASDSRMAERSAGEGARKPSW